MRSRTPSSQRVGVDVLLQRAERFVLPGVHVGDLTVAAYEDRRREPGDRSQRTQLSDCRLIARIADRMLGKERPRVARGFVAVAAEECDTTAVAKRGRSEQWEFLLTGGAPRRPRID